MILQDLLYEILFVDIEEQIKRLYPEDIEFMGESKFKQLYFALMQVEPSINDGVIKIKPIGSESVIWEIYADRNGEEFALDFAPWKDILGMSVDDAIFDYMTEAEFLARCFWMISFFGFSEEEREERLEEMITLDFKNCGDADKFILEFLAELLGNDLFEKDMDISITIESEDDE